MGYILRRSFEVFIAAIHVVFLKLIYGRSINGPFFCFGSGLNLSIRRGGKFKYGKIIARRGLSVFCDGGHVQLDDGVFLNNNCSINSRSRILVGKHTLFGEGVKIYDHDHAIDLQGLVSKDIFHTAPISIGSNCWIGSNSVILKGVDICDGAIIGAGAVIVKSIDSPGIYVAKGLADLHKLDKRITQQ